MSVIMFGFLTIIIFLIVGFGIGFASACVYYLFHNRPVRRYQFAEPPDRQIAFKRQTAPNEEIRTGIDGDTALSGFKKR